MNNKNSPLWPLKFWIYADATKSTIDYGSVPGAVRLSEHNAVRVPVFAYEVVRSERSFTQDGHNLLVETLRIYAPANRFTPGQRVGTKLSHFDWYIDGYPEDNNVNPWYSPGLVTYIAERRKKYAPTEPGA